MTKEIALEILKDLDVISGGDVDQAIQFAIRELEQESCEDAISRQAVLDIIDSDWKYEGMEQYVNELPSVKSQEKTGNWIKFVVNGQHKIKCDKCDYTESEYVTHIRNYCPNCGAKMESGG